MDEMVGIVKSFAGSYVPTGYMACDGTKLQANQYPVLFSVLGSKYGGDGIHTFALPDLRPNKDGWGYNAPMYIICVQGIYPPRD